MTAYSERTSDPNHPNKPLAETLLKDTNGDLWVTRHGQAGRLQMKMGNNRKWVGRFEALREDSVQGNTKFAVTRVSNTEDKELYQRGMAGENFLSGTSLDAMGLVRDSYEVMGGQVTPGDDKYFRGIAYGLETGRLTADAAQRLLSLRYSIQRAKNASHMANAAKGSGTDNREFHADDLEDDLAR